MASNRRLPGWPERLAACIASARTRRFQWGEHDCCLWAATVIYTMTGVDPGRAFRGAYASSTMAARRLNGVSLGDFLEAVARQWGFPEIAPASAQRGDVMLCDTTGRAGWPVSCGICAGSVVLSTGRDGLRALPVSSGLRAWSI